MGKLILYGIEASPPVRCVQLTLHALELDYDFCQVNLLGGENKSDDFLKKNPQGTVPVLEDEGKLIWDSHAIASYLVRKYAKSDTLYPEDFYQRAVVDQRLHFDSGVLFPSLKNITAPLFFKNETNIPQEKFEAIYDAFNLVESFLQHEFIAGNQLTIADFSFISTMTSFEAIAKIDPVKTPKIIAWMDRLTELPYYEEANGKGATTCTKMLKAKFDRD